ncbi:uncharacterized protein LOC141600325 [Silene latifolia]|uniref:uncharacterized protein LOC141600325 n=1 Tax=Silene latifolia TaxID=37657 RepID=UPI003D787148
MTTTTTTASSNDLFTSLISDIKSYSGNDPLLPWLRGVRKLRDSLPPQLLKDKLPRFLQKCAQTFDSDRRYRNDLRYLRIWLQLMDYVDDPKALLRTMEVNKIGMKRSLYYQAYALYYEKIKKFDNADQMYRLGVQNLAEPLDELQKSYELFIRRIERHKNKRVQRQEKRTGRRPLSDRSSTNPNCSSGSSPKVDEISGKSLLEEPSTRAPSTLRNVLTGEFRSSDQDKLCRDDSLVAKFVDSAIIGRSEVEDACHHGLVEPTINTKEALNAINNMFREPIEPENAISRSSRSKPKVNQNTDNVFEVFVDENSDVASRQQDNEKHKTLKNLQEPLQIFIDDESSNDSEASDSQTPMDDGSPSSSELDESFVFLRPSDHQSESPKKTRTIFRDDTVVRKFVGSAILDEPEVEDICHHGLVDPTVNLKEAMEDINGMFGKPIDFVRATRRKRQEKEGASGKNDHSGFLILPDDEFSVQEVQQSSQNSSIKNTGDLYETTVFTKEAMDDINNLFSMPLDF